MTTTAVRSICIPRMEQSISKIFIFKAFCDANIGYIESIIEMPYRNDPQYKRVIVKIKWNDSPNAKMCQQRFAEDKNVKIAYTSYSYWICLPNRIHPNLQNAIGNISPQQTDIPADD